MPASCQAARAQIAARQQHLHLRGLGADDISVFIVVAVAYLLSTPGARANYRPGWARGCRGVKPSTGPSLAARVSPLAGRLEPHPAPAVTSASHPYGVAVPVVIKCANRAGREGSAVCARRAQSQFMMG